MAPERTAQKFEKSVAEDYKFVNGKNLGVCS